MTTLIEREIAEQPDVLRRLIAAEKDHVAAVAQQIKQLQPKFAVIVARGTSDNAARYAQYIFGSLAGLYTGLATPSLTTLYNRTPRFDDALVIGISQSGQSLEPTRVLEQAHDHGAVMTLSITNDRIPAGAGGGRAYRAARRAGAQPGRNQDLHRLLMAIALLAGNLGQPPGWEEEIAQVPDWAAETQALHQDTRAAAARYTFMTHCVTLARGYNYCTASEIAIKLKELSYVAAEAYSSADFHHGPKAIVSPGFPLIAIAPEGAALDTMRDSLVTFRDSKADLAIISNVPDLLEGANLPLPIPAGVPEWLSPLITVLPGQMLAFGLSEARGVEVDSPRGLNKVTYTE